MVKSGGDLRGILYSTVPVMGGGGSVMAKLRSSQVKRLMKEWGWSFTQLAMGKCFLQYLGSCAVISAIRTVQYRSVPNELPRWTCRYKLDYTVLSTFTAKQPAH